MRLSDMLGMVGCEGEENGPTCCSLREREIYILMFPEIHTHTYIFELMAGLVMACAGQEFVSKFLWDISEPMSSSLHASAGKPERSSSKIKTQNPSGRQVIKAIEAEVTRERAE